MPEVNPEKIVRKRPAIVYIDGFNLFYSLKENHWKQYYWLNVVALAERLVGPEHELMLVKYFTSPIPAPSKRHDHQRVYLNALRSLSPISILLGYHQEKTERRPCDNCGEDGKFSYFVEKKTDVNIATEILCDSFTPKYEKAIVITADNDLTSPLEKYRKIHKGNKKIYVALPPKRPGVKEPKELSNAANRVIHINEEHVKASLLDRRIKTIGGIITCPDGWLPESRQGQEPTDTDIEALKLKFGH